MKKAPSPHVSAHPTLIPLSLQTEPPTQPQVKKSARGLTTTDAPEAANASLPTSVGTQAARVCTLEQGAPRRRELQRAHTSTHSHFEKEPQYTSHKRQEALTTNSQLESELIQQGLREEVLVMVHIMTLPQHIMTLCQHIMTFLSISAYHAIMSVYHAITSVYHAVTSAYHDVTSAYHDVTSAYHDVTSAYHDVTSAYHDVTSAYHDVTSAYHDVTSA